MVNLRVNIFQTFSLDKTDERSREVQNPLKGIRQSSSSPIGIPNGNNHTIRNAFSHNPLNISERYLLLLLYFIK